MSNVPDIGEFVKHKKGQSLYDLGYKFCTACQKFFKVLSRKCQLCGRRLRYRPKGHAKKVYNERNRIYERLYSINYEKMLLQNT